jgi:hypothetical protein
MAQISSRGHLPATYPDRLLRKGDSQIERRELSERLAWKIHEELAGADQAVEIV